MRHPSRTPLHILLALLLLFSPLQSVLAGVATCSMKSGSVPVMEHVETHTMAIHDTGSQGTDCPQCVAHDGCDDTHGCTTHAHCASCVPGIPTYGHQLVMSGGSDDYVRADESLNGHHISHPFRPPKA